ncbi:MAG: ABC transporter ATP-binding protein/permease [Candidatus Izemoplasmatales bacterium]|nr:ABC transporter ATP-binding protein/permease [Candidatus Izemoplasmatales bacterium]
MLEVKNIKKEYFQDKESSTIALNDVSLTFSNRGMVFIVGKSGSGKTTLFNIIGILDKPTKGAVIYKGTCLSNLREFEKDMYRNNSVGYIFQEYNLIETLNIRKNISLALELQGKQANEEDIKGVLDLVEMSDYQDRMPNEISTGQKQRIAIARALIKEPLIILADEPTGALDFETGVQIMKILKEVSNNRLVLVITHDTDIAYDLGDRIVTLKDGVVIKDEIISETYSVNLVDTDKANSEYSKKASGLSIKNSFRQGTSGIFKKPLRFLITILVIAITLLVFGVSMSLSNYETIEAVQKSYQKSDIEYFSFEKQESYFDEIYGEILFNPFLNTEDLTLLRNRFPESNFYPIIKCLSGTIQENIYNSFSDDDYYHSDEIYGGMEVSDDVFSDFGATLVFGNLPKESISDNEVLITKYIFETFKEYGYLDKTTNEHIPIHIYSDIIGKEITIENESFEIVGIIDTNFDGERYETLKDVSNIDFITNISLSEFDSYVRYSMHSLFFVREGYYNEKIFPNSYSGTYVIEDQPPLRIDISKLLTDDNSNNTYMDFYYIANEDYISENTIWKDGNELSNLDNNQVILPIALIPSDVSFDNVGTIDSLLADEVESIVLEYALEHFDEIPDSFNPHPLREETYLDYAEYILYFTDSGNDYQEGKDISYFLDIAYSSVLDKYFFDILDSIEIFRDYHGLRLNETIEIVGFYNTTSFRGHDEYPIIFSESLFNDLMSKVDYDFSFLISSLSESDEVNNEVILFSYDTSSNIQYKLTSYITITLEYYDSIFSSISNIMFVIGLVFIFLSILLLMIFISSNINIRKKEIGILRAIGAKTSDLIKIFSLEGLTMALLSAIVSSGLFIIFHIVLSTLTLNKYSLFINILPFSVIPILIMFTISLVAGFTSSIIPIVRFSKKQPIDVIRNIS